MLSLLWEGALCLILWAALFLPLHAVSIPHGECPLPQGQGGRPKVFTYFQQGTAKEYYPDAKGKGPGKSNHYISDFGTLLPLWRTSWAANGWHPTVLAGKYAIKHPLFPKLREVVSKLPTFNNNYYEMQCYVRWLAVAIAGGGIMVDYDVINYGWRPPRTINCSLMTYSGSSLSPAFVSGSKEAFYDVVERMINYQPQQLTLQTNIQGGQPPPEMHMSDQEMLRGRLFPLTEGPWMMYMMNEAGWTNAHLVHYTHAFTRKPRWYWILKLGWCWGVPSELHMQHHKYEGKFKSLFGSTRFENYSCPSKQHPTEGSAATAIPPNSTSPSNSTSPYPGPPRK